MKPGIDRIEAVDDDGRRATVDVRHRCFVHRRLLTIEQTQRKAAGLARGVGQHHCPVGLQIGVVQGLARGQVGQRVGRGDAEHEAHAPQGL